MSDFLTGGSFCTYAELELALARTHPVASSAANWPGLLPNDEARRTRLVADRACSTGQPRPAEGNAVAGLFG